MTTVDGPCEESRKTPKAEPQKEKPAGIRKAAKDVLAGARAHLVVAGAGASAGIFPSSAEVTRFLTNWTAWRATPPSMANGTWCNAWKYLREECQPSGGSGPDGRSPFFAKMERLWRRPGAGSPDFEDLIAAVDAWVFAGQPSPDWVPKKVQDWLKATLPAPPPGCQPHPSIRNWAWQLSNDVRNAILGWFADLALRYIESRTVQTTGLGVLVTCLRDRARMPVVVVNLNYDNALELHRCPRRLQIDWGFPTHAQSSGVFDIPAGQFFPVYVANKSDVRYVPVHGSLHFGVGPDGLRWFADIAAAESSRRLSSTCMPVTFDQDRQNALFVTGRGKEEYIRRREPFRGYLDAVPRLAGGCDCWWIVGYSGRDAHLNEALRGVLNERGAGGLNTTVVICTPSPEDAQRLATGVVGKILEQCHWNAVVTHGDGVRVGWLRGTLWDLNAVLC